MFQNNPTVGSFLCHDSNMFDSISLVDVMSFFGLSMGVVATLIGCLAALAPKKMSEGFGIPADDQGKHYVFALGARDIFVGIVVLVLWWQAQWQSLGYVCFAIAFVALCDFYIVFKNGVKKAAVTHLLGFVASFVFAFLFLSLN